VTADCPPDEQIAAHVAGGLDAAAAAALGVHLDTCPGCRAAVVALVRARGTPAPADQASSSPSSGSAGTALGRYRIERVLGAGAMGVVYAAHDPALERTVAIKVLRPELVGAGGALAERMIREARLLARVSDPAVITIHDVGELDGQVYLAMELCEGETLAAWLRAPARTVAEVLAVLARAGAGLAAAHRAGVIHRDFKPDNVLVAPAGAPRPTRVVVTDFGVARAVDVVVEGGGAGVGASVELTGTGIAIGTPAYMAPEQLAGAAAEVRSDVFAFAVTAWEALYGARPFAGRTVAELAVAIAAGPPTPSPRSPRGAVPARVRGALGRALAAVPAARPASVDEVVLALAPARPPTRARAAAVGAVALGLAAVAALAVRGRGGRAAVPHDPCAAGQVATARLAAPTALAALARAAGPTVVGVVRGRAHALFTAYGAACAAEPSPPVVACLEARHVELSAVIAELTARPGVDPVVADALVFTIAEPSTCHAAGVATLEPRWPRDPAQRSAVAEVRLKAIAAEGLRDAARFAEARAAVLALAPAVAAAGWPPLEAEHLYLRGGVETIGGDASRGRELMAQAAARAEEVHADYIAASAWSQLVQAATWDERDPERGLEYAAYADAASARLGRPITVETHVRYSRGTARIAAADHAGGEADLRVALELAERGVPAMVPAIIQGLGLALEERGDYAAAVDTYRRALAALERAGGRGTPPEALFRNRLAVCLAHVGDTTAAAVEARAAVALADAILDVRHPDRAIAHLHLAEVLHAGAADDDALREIRVAQELLATATGERSDLYGNALTTEASILTARDPRRAAELAERACEIQAYNVGDDAPTVASCWSEAAVALQAAGRHREAERRLVTSLPILEANLGPDHALVANAYIGLGEARLARGDRAAAAAAFEQGRDRMSRSSIDDGYLGTAEHGLARAIAAREPARAHALMTQAAARWADDPRWAAEYADAKAWLRRQAR
jgi:tetratricopeptide (TPR) repeat protein